MTQFVKVAANRQFGKGAKALTEKYKEIAKAYAQELAQNGNAAIESDLYNVPFASIRTQSRQFVPAGLRNIVDSGELRDSLQITESGNTISISWTAPHASAARFGYATYNRAGQATGRFMPGRDWIAIALKTTPSFKEFGAKVGGLSIKASPTVIN